MRFTANKTELVDKLTVVTRGLSTRSSIQALAGIRVTVGETVVLEATDMEIGFRIELEADIDQTGIAVLPGRLLLDVIRQVPNGSVAIAVNSESRDVTVEAGSSLFRIRTLPTDDFPVLPVAEGDSVTIPAAGLAETVDRVARAASRDETRPHLTGVLVSTEDKTLRMVATDSYRLSVKETSLSDTPSQAIEANIPARTLQELARLVDRGSHVDIALSERQAVFTAGDVTLTSRLVDGQFPNYKQLLPDSYDHEIKVQREELLEVVRRISLLAQRNTPLKLAFAEGEVTVSSQTPDVGEARETLPLQFHGEPLEIGFNAEYFRGGLESCESDEVTLKLINSVRPAMIESSPEEGLRYLVMPIRLNT